MFIAFHSRRRAGKNRGAQAVPFARGSVDRHASERSCPDAALQRESPQNREHLKNNFQ